MIERWIGLLGVEVLTADCPSDWWGYYDPDWHAIVLRPDLAPIQWRSTLAHELGHAYYRHRGTTPKQELEAAAWAARALIRPCDFIKATAALESPVAVADELGVLPRDVIHYVESCPHYAADAVSTCS